MTHGADRDGDRSHDEGGRVLVAADAEPAARVAWAPDLTARLGGVWWPRTHDAATELTALLPSAEAHLGPGVTRVSLSMRGWSPEQPRQLRIVDRLLRLGWFRTLDPSTATLGRGKGQRTTLLVIPPSTDEATGRRLFEALTAAPWPVTAADALAVDPPAVQKHSTAATA